MPTAPSTPATPQPDWAAPWHMPIQPLAQQAHAQWQALGSARAALNAQPCAACVRFVAQDDLPEGMAYEQFIFDTRQVPTRDNLHDFYNGVMWLHFPHTKRCLNALQGAELARMGGVHASRGPVRDALTLFDENVLLLQAPDALWQALAEKRWGDVFGTWRTLWHDPAQVRLVVFGHALLEQLVTPFKSLTAHVYRVPHHVAAGTAMRHDWLPLWDDWLARDLTAEKLASKPFAHLPVLGIPGWCAENESAGFYADASVFRPLRKPLPTPA